MKVSPCLQPKRIFDKNSKCYRYVPCGKCDACVCGKGFRLSERLGETISRFTYKYFVTLTFNDEHLPLATYDSDTDCFVHPLDYDYNGSCYSIPSELVEKSLYCTFLQRTLEKFGALPVLSHRVAILFKKRLRKLFAKIYDKQYLFIYIVGEYGATTYRPHYHCVLCTNAPVHASVLENCVHSAWSDFDKVKQEYVSEYGKIDFQRVVSRGVRNYVAQYLNSVTHLPPCYASGLFRPFYQSSPLIDTDSLRFRDISLETMFNRCSPEAFATSFADNSTSLFPLPIGIVNRYFPKCYKFSSLSDCDRVQLYSVFLRQPFISAERFADSVLNSFCIGSFDSIELCRNLFVDSDLVSSRQRLIRHFYISRKVCLNAQRLCVSLEVYVNRIILFWSRYELLKLRNFYDLQIELLEDKFNPCSLVDLFSLYYDTDEKIRHLSYYVEQFNFPTSLNSFRFLASHSEYSCLMHKILLDTTKTKKRNDYFFSKGYKRPSFLSKFKLKQNVKRFFQS